MTPYIVHVTYYIRIRNGHVEFVRQHFRRPWGSVRARRIRRAYRRRFRR